MMQELWRTIDTSGSGSGAPNLYFSESWYLATYPDVRQAVADGDLACGYEHFCRHGHVDRAPHWLFNPGYYCARYAERYGRKFASERHGDCYDHFLRVGQNEGLSGHPLFDSAVYTALAAHDVQLKIKRDGPFTVFLTHCHVPGAEPVASNQFDQRWYLTRYPHVSAEIAQGRWLCALHHYSQNPNPTGYDPSERFSEQGYLQHYPDVAEAVDRKQIRNGFAHFIEFGHAEGRCFLPAGTDPQTGAAGVASNVTATAAFPLQSRRFENVTLLPCKLDRPASPNGYSFGVLDQDGNPIDAFAHPWLSMRRPDPSIDHDPRTFIYGGVLVDHFGHVLRDSLARLWFIRERSDLPILWHWMDLPVLHDCWQGWLDQLWQVLGLSEREHRRVMQPISVGKLILPEAGLLTSMLLHENQVRALGAQAGRSPSRGGRIWLSRAGLPAQFGRINGEDVVQAILVAAGWTILRPEEMRVADQVDIFASADVIAGFMSSAFHAALLSQAPQARIILIKRPGVEQNFYDAVADARHLHQTYITPKFEPYRNAGAWTTYTLKVPETLAAEICDRAGPMDTKPPAG